MANAIEEYRKKAGIQTTRQPNAIEQYRSSVLKKEQQTPSAVEIYRQKNGIAPKTTSNDLKSSDGLYELAVQNGLKNRADSILASQRGEETKKIYSGGFISDIFDTLNAAQYGVVGVLKGKSFVEGVQTRQSFSDKDALGDKGLPGVIAGIALDIAVDPFTYIAPWTIAKKISPINKAVQATKAAVFGKKVTKAVDTGLKLSGEVASEANVTQRMFKEVVDQIGAVSPDIAKSLNKINVSKVSKLDDLGTLLKKAVPATDDYAQETVSRMVRSGKEILENTPRTFNEIEGGTKLGKYLAQKFQWMSGADPVFRETFERGLKNTAISTDNIVQMSKGVSKLTPEVSKKLLIKDATGRFIRVGLPALQKTLSPEDFQTVAEVYNKIDNLGKEAVDLGLLSKAKYEENIGTYLKNAYDEYELAKKGGLFGSSKVGIKGIFKRKELSEEAMKELGQIDNPAYLLFKSAFDLSKDVENAKMFRTIAQKFGTDTAQEGFTKLPDGARLGSLAGKHVPSHMAEYLKEIIEPSKNTIAKELVANFKFFKVVMNPGTHARNIISNKILNYWKLGMNPLDPRVIKSDITAIKEIAKGAGKWSDEARPLGYNLDTFASAEMKTLLESTEANAWGKTVSAWGKTKKVLGDMYQAEENQAKLSAYIFQRTVKNLDPETAWKAAESATFNYAQVTPFVRKLRESLFGFPFITFTVKSTPLAIETMLKNPNRVSVIGKIKQGIENLSDIKETDRERANEPSWVKDGFYIKLPIKDKEGRSSYFDLTYILPFGDLVAGNFFETGQNMQTGLPESQVTSMMKKSPFIQTVTAIGKNQDFYGNSIWKNSDPSAKQLGDLMNYLTKVYAPPLVGDQLPGGYNEKGERQNKGIINSLGASAENQKRNLMQELMRNVGVKIQPIDADIQETYTEWNKKKALQNLLKENGILNEFNINYLPKE